MVPDSTLIILESKEYRALIKSWYEANPEVKERGTFVFPISLEYPDGAKVEIDTKEDFEEIKNSSHLMGSSFFIAVINSNSERKWVLFFSKKAENFDLGNMTLLFIGTRCNYRVDLKVDCV